MIKLPLKSSEQFVLVSNVVRHTCTCHISYISQAFRDGNSLLNYIYIYVSKHVIFINEKVLMILQIKIRYFNKVNIKGNIKKH